MLSLQQINLMFIGLYEFVYILKLFFQDISRALVWDELILPLIGCLAIFIFVQHLIDLYYLVLEFPISLLELLYVFGSYLI